jgi:hypothetical protein
MITNSPFLDICIYLIITILSSVVFFILKYIFSKIVWDIYIKYILIDSLALWVYSMIVITLLDSLPALYQNNINSYQSIVTSFYIGAFLSIVIYFFIKCFFLKSHPKLTGVYGFIGEVITFTIWIVSSMFIWYIAISFAIWE